MERRSNPAASVVGAAAVEAVANALDAAVLEHGFSKGFARAMKPNGRVLYRDVEHLGSFTERSPVRIDQRKYRRVTGPHPLHLAEAAPADLRVSGPPLGQGVHVREYDLFASSVAAHRVVNDVAVNPIKPSSI